MENGDCNHHCYHRLKGAVRPTDQWERSRNWDLVLDNRMECTLETKHVWECGVAPISLERDAQREEDFDTKRGCPEFPRKARRWQTDCSGIQAWLIRYWTFLSVSEDLSGPNCTLKPVSMTLGTPYIFCRKKKTDRQRQ